MLKQNKPHVEALHAAGHASDCEFEILLQEPQPDEIASVWRILTKDFAAVANEVKLSSCRWTSGRASRCPTLRSCISGRRWSGCSSGTIGARCMVRQGRSPMLGKSMSAAKAARREDLGVSLPRQRLRRLASS